MKRLLNSICFLFLCIGCFHAQTFLRVGNARFNTFKAHDVFINESLEYKLKGDFTYRKTKLIALSDSTLVFTNNTEVKWSELKALRLNSGSNLVTQVSFIFIAGGIGFFPLNTLNNVIIREDQIINAGAAYISAGLLTTGYLIKMLGKKRVRINKDTYLKVLTVNYQDMNSKEKGQ